MARRLVGVVLAVLACVVAAGLVSSEARSTRDAAEREAKEDTEKAANAAVAAVQALPDGLKATSKQAAELPGLASAVSTLDTSTIHDLLTNEDAWAPFRSVGPTGVYIGDGLTASTGDEAAVRAAAALAKKAQGGSEASTFLVVDGTLYLAAAHAGAPTPNNIPVAAVVLKPLAKDALGPVATAQHANLALRLGGKELFAAGDAMTQTEGPCCTVRAVLDGVELAVRRNVDAPLAQAKAKSDRFGLTAYGLAALVAVAALAFGFWPKNKEAEAQAALLQQTAEELRQSRLELTNLTNRVTQSGNFAQPGAGAPAPAEPTFGATVTTQASRYEEVMPLGEGGMARVSIAMIRGAEGFRRYFVVKRLKGEMAGYAETVNQFIDEARLTASLVHSNIIPVFDFGRDAQGYFLASEYILGRSVDKLVERSLQLHGRGLPPTQVRFLGLEALKALAYAHAKTDEAGKPLALVHRDVSPANLLVSAQGEVKLLDFGIVKSDARTNKTQAGVVKGNLFYMSPEQATAQVVDPRADLYSLGLVLFTAATGKTLYQGENAYDLLTLAAKGPTPDDLAKIRALPEGLGPVVERAVQPNRELRYASAEEFSQALASSGVAASAAELQATVQALVGDELTQETQRLQKGAA